MWNPRCFGIIQERCQVSRYSISLSFQGTVCSKNRNLGVRWWWKLWAWMRLSRRDRLRREWDVELDLGEIYHQSIFGVSPITRDSNHFATFSNVIFPALPLTLCAPYIHVLNLSEPSCANPTNSLSVFDLAPFIASLSMPHLYLKTSCTPSPQLWPLSGREWKLQNWQFPFREVLRPDALWNHHGA